MSLTQSEADYLLKLEKQFTSDEPLVLGDTPLDFSRDLVSSDGREFFAIDVWRGTFNLRKYKLQERARVAIPLLRVDVGGAPHTNPDGTYVPCPHIHIYREGYDDKWAYALKEYPSFTKPDDIVSTFEEFAKLCNIRRLPQIQRSML